jgi:hypothetical protein
MTVKVIYAQSPMVLNRGVRYGDKLEAVKGKNKKGETYYFVEKIKGKPVVLYASEVVILNNN